MFFSFGKFVPLADFTLYLMSGSVSGVLVGQVRCQG